MAMEALAVIVVMLGNEWLTPHELCGTSTAWNASGEERLRRAHRGTPLRDGLEMRLTPHFPHVEFKFFFVDGRGLPSQWGCDWQSGRRIPGGGLGTASGGLGTASGGVDATRRHAPWTDCANAAVH